MSDQSGSDPTMVTAADHEAYIRPHIAALEETIGVMRGLLLNLAEDLYDEGFSDWARKVRDSIPGGGDERDDAIQPTAACDEGER